ncbi:MAG: LysM peptidoglycan-binding domain-containing protein [Ornithinibacter sp.]
MSALAWDPADIGYAVDGATRRPHLVVLPGGEAGARGGSRITRRGRLALLTLVIVAAAALGLVGLRGAGAAEPPRTLSVQPGQTLSEIAASELPALSISDGIVAIQLANRLSTAQISAGQELVIPAS